MLSKETIEKLKDVIPQNEDLGQKALGVALFEQGVLKKVIIERNVATSNNIINICLTLYIKSRTRYGIYSFSKDIWGDNFQGKWEFFDEYKSQFNIQKGTFTGDIKSILEELEHMLINPDCTIVFCDRRKL